MSARYVLGVNIGFHDSSAALVRDGALCALVEQERVSRRKHAVGQPPAEAVAACLAMAGIGPQEVDTVAIGWDFRDIPLGRNRRFTTEGLRAMLFPDDEDLTMPAVRWVPHHVAHAASAAYSCDCDEAAVLVLDGAGETQSTSFGRYADGEIEILREWPVEQSLGFYYNAAAEWAGLGYWGTGKLMGLAAYGRPGPGAPVRAVPGGYELVRGTPTAEVPTRRAATLGPLMAYYPAVAESLKPEFGKLFPYAPRTGEEPIAYADFAATIQQGLEETVLSLAADLRRRVDTPVLALAGGVAMNCTMIGVLVRSGLFDRVYVPPVPTDAGVSLGAALVAARECGSSRPPASTTRTGVSRSPRRPARRPPRAPAWRTAASATATWPAASPGNSPAAGSWAGRAGGVRSGSGRSARAVCWPIRARGATWNGSTCSRAGRCGVRWRPASSPSACRS